MSGAESNYVLRAIRTFGPKVLVELLKENHYENLLPDKYIKEATCDVCFKTFSNRNICEMLDKLIPNNEKFKQKTAYGRYYHMNEIEMLDDAFPKDFIRNTLKIRKRVSKTQTLIKR